MKPSKFVVVRRIRKPLRHAYTLALLFLDTISHIHNFKAKRLLNPVELRISNYSYTKVAVFASFINSLVEQNEALRVIDQIYKEFDRVLIVNSGILKFSTSYSNVFVINRSNYGRDIASYKLATDILNLENTVEILYFNDSVIWSGKSIARFVTQARESEYEVTSLTSSKNDSLHLQSYALYLRGNIVQLTKAFNEIKVSNFKRLIVEFGEKALSRFWISRNFTIGGIHKLETLSPLLEKYVDLYPEDYETLQSLIEQNVPLNPSIHLWAPLYAETGVIKKSLIYQNPAKLKYSPKSLAEVQSRIDLIS